MQVVRAAPTTGTPWWSCCTISGSPPPTPTASACSNRAASSPTAHPATSSPKSCSAASTSTRWRSAATPRPAPHSCCRDARTPTGPPRRRPEQQVTSGPSDDPLISSPRPASGTLKVGAPGAGARPASANRIRGRGATMGRAGIRAVTMVGAIAMVVLAGCSSESTPDVLQTIEPATPAAAPEVGPSPAGDVRPLDLQSTRWSSNRPRAPSPRSSTTAHGSRCSTTRPSTVPGWNRAWSTCRRPPRPS